MLYGIHKMLENHHSDLLASSVRLAVQRDGQSLYVACMSSIAELTENTAR